MVKEVKYRCNLCREHRELVPKQDTILGVRFLSGLKSGWLKLCDPVGEENHICRFCAESICRQMADQRQHLSPLPVAENKE